MFKRLSLLKISGRRGTRKKKSNLINERLNKHENREMAEDMYRVMHIQAMEHEVGSALSRNTAVRKNPLFFSNLHQQFHTYNHYEWSSEHIETDRKS
jgi:hypothetical protein